MPILHSRAGAVVQWLVGGLMGKLTAMIVSLGVVMPAESYASLETALQAVGAFLVTFAIQWYQAVQNRKVQAAIGAIPDSWIGDETVDIAKALISPFPPSAK